MAMQWSIEFEKEADGRWIAEVVQISGVMVYGRTRKEALTRVLALAQSVEGAHG
jgi:predicted RNase H-like HicB family nuclease